jgi:hypothetical protein
MPQPIKNIAGERFGMLVAVQLRGIDHNRKAVWLFKCDCGNDHEANATNVKRKGGTMSCGCAKADRMRDRGEEHPFFKHGNATKENLSVYRSHQQSKYRKIRRDADAGDLTVEILNAKFDEQAGCCAYCFDPLGDDKELDHIIPIIKGGQHTDENTCWSCRPCNRQKKDRLISEWLQTAKCRARIA